MAELSEPFWQLLREDIAFVCVVTIGRQPPQADDAGQVSRLTQSRKPLDELVRWEHWEEA